MQCNTDIFGDHENIALIVKCASEGILLYKLHREEAVTVLCTFKIKKYQKCWVVYVRKLSAVLIEATISNSAMCHLWGIICNQFDYNNPVPTNRITKLRNELFPVLSNYINNYSNLICEAPLIEGRYSHPQIPNQFSAYCLPTEKPRIRSSILLNNSLEESCIHIADIVDEAYNFLRVEASEIIAFLATDCDRIIKPGIPPHIPLAYGMRGPSLSNKTMQSMVNDIHSELHQRNTKVLCEVYDGQFHDLIVHDSYDGPLTRLQLSKQIFKDTMDLYDKAELLDTLLPYSSIDENDITDISSCRFRNEHEIQLNSISLSMRRRLVHDINEHFVRTISIETNPVADFSLCNIVTHHRTNIWN